MTFALAVASWALSWLVAIGSAVTVVVALYLCVWAFCRAMRWPKENR